MIGKTDPTHGVVAHLETALQFIRRINRKTVGCKFLPSVLVWLDSTSIGISAPLFRPRVFSKTDQ